MFTAAVLNGRLEPVMSREPTTGELALMIGSLTDEVKDGFAGVYARQDKTNGNVQKNTEFRLKSEEFVEIVKSDRQNTFKRYSDLVWKVGTSTVLALIGVKLFL